MAVRLEVDVYVGLCIATSLESILSDIRNSTSSKENKARGDATETSLIPTVAQITIELCRVHHRPLGIGLPSTATPSVELRVGLSFGEQA